MRIEMKVLTDWKNIQLEQTAVCIGKFDGIHRGHRALLEEAGKSGLPLVMLTFIFPGHRGIYSYDEKMKLAGELGVDVFLAVPVTESFMSMSAAQFVQEVLFKHLNAKNVVVGADFCFGHNRQGTAVFLKEQGEQYGFDVEIMEKVQEDGEVISSTRIRALLREGKIKKANELLKSPYFMCGTVEKGNQIGRTMSVPTANIYPSEQKELPPFGVYAVRVLVDGTWYNAVSNLGVKPTIPGENPVGLEVWLFDFQGNLYGKDLMVEFYEFQRPEREFASLSELKAQIEKDTAQAAEILENL